MAGNRARRRRAGAAAAAIAASGNHPADLTFTPQSETQIHEHRRRPGVGQELLRRTGRRRGCRAGGLGRAAEPRKQLRGRGAVRRRPGRQLARRAQARGEPGARARRRRHHADHLELRALQQLGLQRGHQRHLRRADGRDVHREHVPGDARDGRLWPTRPRPGLFDLLHHRARRLAAPGDDRQPAERHCGRAAADRPGHAQREDRPGGRRRLRGADADRHGPRRSSATACSPSRRSARTRPT